MAKGFLSQGEDRTVVAVIGDGALTGGMAWEALNSIADQQGLRLVIVVNDNGRSYTPTVGGLANQLAIIRTDPHYEEALDRMKRHVTDKPLGKQVFGLMHAAKAGVKTPSSAMGFSPIWVSSTSARLMATMSSLSNEPSSLLSAMGIPSSSMS